MGRRLAARGLRPQLILSSPAVRARDTASLIASELGYPQDDIKLDERIYDADTAILAQILWGIDERFDVVMIFGHNPTLTEFVNEFAGAGIANIPTCGVATLQFDVALWVDAHRATLVDFDFPKNAS